MVRARKVEGKRTRHSFLLPLVRYCMEELHYSCWMGIPRVAQLPVVLVHLHPSIASSIASPQTETLSTHPLPIFHPNLVLSTCFLFFLGPYITPHIRPQDYFVTSLLRIPLPLSESFPNTQHHQPQVCPLSSHRSIFPLLLNMANFGDRRWISILSSVLSYTALTSFPTVNPFAKRETHSSTSITTYKVLTLLSWVLSVITTVYYDFESPHDGHLIRRTIWGQNYAHPSGFTQNATITSIYW